MGILTIQHNGKPEQLQTALNETAFIFPGTTRQSLSVDAREKSSIQLPGILIELKTPHAVQLVVAYLRARGINAIPEQLSGAPLDIQFGEDLIGEA